MCNARLCANVSDSCILSADSIGRNLPAVLASGHAVGGHCITTSNSLRSSGFMRDEHASEEGRLTWKFPPTFWFANGAELCERAAFYGMFITLMRYLNTDIGFTDQESGLISWRWPSSSIQPDAAPVWW